MLQKYPLYTPWYTVEKNINDKLYFTYQDGPNKHETIITIDSKNDTLDTLVDELQIKIDTHRLTAPSWFQTLLVAVIVSDAAIGNVSIRHGVSNPAVSSSSGAMPTSTTIPSSKGGRVDTTIPSTHNLLTSSSKTTSRRPTATPSPLFQASWIQSPITTVYIKSPQLGTFQNIGPQGERDILKKVSVHVPFGDLIIDQWVNSEESRTVRDSH